MMLLLSGCNDKLREDYDKAEALLSKISYNLEVIADDCEFAERKGDYDLMEEELGMTQLRCEEMKKEIEDALLFGFN